MGGNDFTEVFLKLFIFCVLCVKNNAMPCHPKCVCKSNIVTCDKVGLNDHSIVDLKNWLPRNVREIRITGNQIHELPKNMFGNCSGDSSKHFHNLTALDLSGNEIKKIHGMTFHCIPNLEELSLADNNWVLHDHTGVFSTLPKLRTLNLTNCFRDKYNNSIHVTKLSWVFYDCDMSEIEFLYLGSNEFQIFTKEAAKAMCTLPKLKMLDMSRNNLSSPVFDDCNRNLKLLDLSHNYIETVSTEMMNAYDRIQQFSPHPKGLTIDFRHNEWDCSCQLRDFVAWIKHTNVTIFQKEKLTCHNGQHGTKKLVDLHPSQMQCQASAISGAQSSNAGVVVLSVLLVIIFCIAAVLLFIKREQVKVYWIRATKPMRDAYLNRKSQFGYSSVSTINT